MNKKFVIKVFTVMSMVIITAIAILGIVLAIVFDETMIRAFGIGMAVGAVIGGAIKCFRIIPKRYEDKDERTLLIALISAMISQSTFGIISYLCLMFVLTGIVEVGSFDTILILIMVAVIVIPTLLAEKISYKIINNRM